MVTIPTLALGVSALAASALAATAPAAFNIGLTIKGSPEVYLTQAGLITSDRAQAASCAILPTTQLSCDGGKTVMATRGLSDMTQLKGVAPSTSLITTGFSVDEDHVLHWKNPDFMMGVPEATWAIYQKTQFYADLGCPHTFHTKNMVWGDVKVYPIEATVSA